MSQARLQKLNALLKRVEVRAAQPRLRAVETRAATAQPARSAAVEPHAPTLTATPARSAPPTVSSFDDELLAPDTLPPTPEPARKAPSNSPLETAMAQLDDSGPLQIQPLAEPIAPAPQVFSAAPGRSLSQDMVLTHRPEAGVGEFDMPIELTQPAAKKPLTPREPTVEFETAKVRISAREARTVVEQPAPEALPAQPEAPLLAPSQTIEAPPLAATAEPARVVSAARVEAPKTFGELLERSLGLRPRA